MKRRAQLNRNYIGKPSSKWKDFWEHPFVRFCTVLIGLAAVAALVIFVLIPLFSGDVSRPLTPNSFQEPAGGEGVTAQQDDLSNLLTEFWMDYNSVIDPYLCGEQIVFSSDLIKKGMAVYAKLVF